MNEVEWMCTDENPVSRMAALLVVHSVGDDTWIVNANEMCCDLIGWTRGAYDSSHDPMLDRQTLIGKPLDVLVPPRYRMAHKLARLMFSANPTPRTMGEGRDTPIWIREPQTTIEGEDYATRLHSIKGTASTAIIGLSPIDDDHTLALIQPMSIGKSFALPGGLL